MKDLASSVGIGETRMSEEYVFIDNLILNNPLEQAIPESGVTIINFVAPSELFDQETIEVH